MTPATVEDAYTMLMEAVAIDDPVVYCEHKYLYYHLKADKLPDKGLPTGRARIAREGRDLTIVSYSAMTQESLAAAEELAREGLEIEVVDLRTVKPLDTDTVLASSRAPVACFASVNHFHGAARTRRSSHGSPVRAFICSMPRPGVSTRKTHRFRIIQISGVRTGPTRKILPQRRALCSENRIYAESRSSCRNLANQSPKPQSSISRSNLATKLWTIRKSSTSRRTKP